MDSISGIGLLLSEKHSGKQIGMIEFTPSGVLVFHVIQQGLHVFALKPIERILMENGLQEPLYVKYADLLKRQSELPSDILEQEASFYAEVLNQLEPPPQVRGKTIQAAMVHFKMKL
jgi:hypothetical protein